MNELANTATFNAVMTPTNFDEAWRYAQIMAASDLVPKDYKGKPENCLVGIQLGAEVGLPPMQAIQNIAVINGRPSVWGDAQLAICLPFLSEFSEVFDELTKRAQCTAVRDGRRVVQSFSKEDAQKANLWNKSGPWTNYPKRMLQMRARGFCLRDICPDKLKGIAQAEEQQDIIRINKSSNELPKIIKPEEVVVEISESIQDNPGWKSLLEKVDLLDMHDELNKLAKKDWTKLEPHRFNGIFKYVMNVEAKMKDKAMEQQEKEMKDEQ